ncbi:MAG: tetratricopeptide repeat protein [Calditrichaeota bacterium]|nr:tetratricopeptide repeat protein [Calditrichota bacterium]
MTLYILTILLLQGSIGLTTASDTDYRLDSTLAVKVIDFISQEQYETALSIADSLISEKPGQPQGWFVKASIHSIRSVDYEDELDDDALYTSSDSVIAICERLMNSGSESPSLRFFSGSVLGYLSFLAYRNGNWLKAIKLGKRSSELNIETLDLDSTFWDAYIGLGSYYFHRSDKAGFLRTIGLVSDKRELGLSMLKTCIEKGTFSSLAAKSQLTWLYIGQKRYEDAISNARELLEIYPRRRAFLWSIGKAQIKSEHWTDAIETYKTLLESIRKDKRNNRYNEIGCLHALAKANTALGEWQCVIKSADEAFKLKVSDDVARRKSKDFKRLKELKKDALKRLESK